MLAFRFVACALVLIGALPAAERPETLKQKFMAPCCWSETLAEHQSPAATQLNAQIDRWIAEGLTDQDIENRLIAEHGRRILAEPGGSQGTLLRVVPFAFLAAGAVWVALLLRRWLRPRPLPA